MVDGLAVQAIAGAHLELVEAVEHVELGQRDAGDAAGPYRLAHHHGVEPAAAALAPGDRAEFVAALAQALADGVVLFGRERPGADARGVRLGDAEHVVERTRPDPRARRGLPRHRVGGGHVGIGAVIDVEHGALGAFEQDTAALAALLVEARPDAAGVGQDLRRDLEQAVEQRPALDLVGAESAQQRIVVEQQLVEARFQRLAIDEIAYPDRAAARPCPRRRGRCRARWCRSCSCPWPPRGRHRACGGAAGSGRRCRRAAARRA